MFVCSRLWSPLLVSILMAVFVSTNVRARSVGLQGMEKMLSSSSSSVSGPSSPISAHVGSHALSKRGILEDGCMGIYNRDIFNKLERVCDDCFNYYRKPYVAQGCRRNCYGNKMFRQCLMDLDMLDVFDEYISMVQIVGK